MTRQAKADISGICCRKTRESRNRGTLVRNMQ